MAYSLFLRPADPKMGFLLLTDEETKKIPATKPIAKVPKTGKLKSHSLPMFPKPKVIPPKAKALKTKEVWSNLLLLTGNTSSKTFMAQINEIKTITATI